MRDAIKAAGASLLYLPPYSPDFNPIENAFSRIKALLRAKAERTIKALWDAVGPLLGLFTPAECANYFKAAGYEPDETGHALNRREDRRDPLAGGRRASPKDYWEAICSASSVTCPSAKRFFRKALAGHGRPDRVVIDGSQTN
ncbi:hypothetical protein X766_33555 [Mesorhizobium sp. LSJC255A00]|nr:hypothetical protein X766_33555 [Mesorhizobium sp. LSJC255A00]